MHADIDVTPIDSCSLKVEGNEGILREIHEHFTFEVPGYQFMPTFQRGAWDGRIRLFQLWQRSLPAGLLVKLISFAKKNDYSISVDPSLFPTQLSQQVFDCLYDSLNFPENFTKEDHQTYLIKRGLELSRALLLSPTGSGKSLIMYALARLCIEQTGKKCLIVVPTTNLVSQIPKEFYDYGYEGSICKWSEDKSNTKAEIFISTYHSVYKLPRKFFDRFGIIMCDEVHLFAAKSTTTMMSKTNSIQYKFGLTATLQDAKCHALTLEGMFGPIVSRTTTKKLMDKGKLTSARIIALLLKHPPDICKAAKKYTYIDEIKEIVKSEKRNNFLVNFISRIPNNTLVLFNHIEHGNLIRDKLIALGTRKIYYIDGSISKEKREEIRVQMEKEHGAILVGSLNCTSTGLNIKNLHNIVFIHPSKAKIRVLQAIGRILRVLFGKNGAFVFDIADDMVYKSHKNTTFEHFMLRLEMYENEGHPVTFKEIKL